MGSCQCPPGFSVQLMRCALLTSHFFMANKDVINIIYESEYSTECWVSLWYKLSRSLCDWCINNCRLISYTAQNLILFLFTQARREPFYILEPDIKPHPLWNKSQKSYIAVEKVFSSCGKAEWRTYSAHFLLISWLIQITVPFWWSLRTTNNTNDELLANIVFWRATLFRLYHG